jgi:membrane protein implicated in regulation of membrane protease activity
MKQITAFAAFALALSLPTAALAYVGPGAGLSLLGALWALVAAIATALLFVVAWPVRKMLRRRRAAASHGHGEAGKARGVLDDPGRHEG